MLVKRQVYLHRLAAMRLPPEVVERMRSWLETRAPNASSLNSQGRRARKVVERAWEDIAALLGARDPGQITYFYVGRNRGRQSCNQGNGVGTMTSKRACHFFDDRTPGDRGVRIFFRTSGIRSNTRGRQRGGRDRSRNLPSRYARGHVLSGRISLQS
jgi:hypothetical protein